VSVLKPILIEGYTPQEILGLPPEQFNNFVFTGNPLVFKAGSAQILVEVIQTSQMASSADDKFVFSLAVIPDLAGCR
jgi:hypothetical protein